MHYFTLCGLSTPAEHLQVWECVLSILCVSLFPAVSKKHGKLITFLRTFMKSRPTKQKLKQRGILRERVFGCDLGEHLLNSGHDGETYTLFHSLCLSLTLFLLRSLTHTYSQKFFSFDLICGVLTTWNTHMQTLTCWGMFSGWTVALLCAIWSLTVW